MQTVVRVGLKVIGAIVIFAAVLLLCMVGAWTIEVLVDPTDKILFVIGLSVLSWFLLVGLMVYRLVTRMRTAMMTLLLAMPTLITMMYGLIFFFPLVKLALQEYAPWAVGAMDGIKDLLQWFGKLFN